MAPKGWIKKREKIDDRIQKFAKISKQEAIIEEIDTEEISEHQREEEIYKPEIIEN